MYRIVLYILFFIILSVNTSAQEYSYVHYDTKDGLAGATVYDITQDKDGFMWFATESGLSRFDGIRFTNYTSIDGLPDNEILKVYGDTKGRVWLAPFGNYICYYKNGKIYNSENDAILKKVSLTSPIEKFAEDREGNVFFYNTSHVYIITANDSVKTIAIPTINGQSAKVGCSMGEDETGVVFAIDNVTYIYRNNHFQFYYSVPLYYHLNKYLLGLHVNKEKNNFDKEVLVDFTMTSYTFDKGYVTFINSKNGSWLIDTVNWKLAEHFLPGKSITCAKQDSEKNYWFSTFGEGVYKLTSKEFKIITDKSASIHSGSKEFFSLSFQGENLFAGAGYGKAYKIQDTGIIEKMDFNKQNLKNTFGVNRLYCIKTVSAETLAVGFDYYLGKIEKGLATFNYDIVAVKSIDVIDKDYLLVGTSRGAYKVRSKDLSIVDTIWRERCTKVFSYNNNYYIGTLHGLFKVDQSLNHKSSDMGLKGRINDIVITKDSSLWIATNNEGIIGYKNEKVFAIINTAKGLSSNNCKTLFCQNNYLWAGTDKGINKIFPGSTNYPVIKYSISDGLASNIINAIYVKDDIVWVATPEGLNYFDQTKISASSKCNLKILDIRVSDKSQPLQSKYLLSYKDNNISFQFTGISFKSSGDITYKYRLIGLNNEWRETKQDVIAYPALPSGEYIFELEAINKYGVKSSVIDIPFVIQTPWFKNAWFLSFAAISFVLLSWFLINRRYKRINNNKEEKRLLQQKIADLEQLALHAQMNPHFIFNCLSSIQNFIINKDFESTNKYMNDFAVILRKTLDNATRPTISIADEVDYISTYLNLEKMRFNNKFEYKITVGKTIPADFTFIPNMILQPFVENSIRHGMRYKENNSGIIHISFEQTETELICIVKDNGIGRKKAAEFKGQQHIEYQSKGMQLTFDRLQLINEGQKEKIMTRIIDLTDDNENACGTIIQINFPLSIIDTLN